MENLSFGYSDAKSKSIIWAAYAEHFAGEEISEEGFNTNSGYVYLALENGVTIASAFGQPVDFIVYNFDTDDEHIFENVDEATEFLQNRF